MSFILPLYVYAVVTTLFSGKGGANVRFYDEKQTAKPICFYQ